MLQNIIFSRFKLFVCKLYFVTANNTWNTNSFCIIIISLPHEVNCNFYVLLKPKIID